MEHVFWLSPGTLAGRPGPNREPWDLADLRQLGIEAVLSLNDGAGCDPGAIAASSMAYRCVPLPPNEPPQPGDEEICRARLPVAYAFVREQHALGRAVLVHCSAGKDRTGMFMAYFLIRECGLDADTAIARVRVVRPRALSALGWETMGREVLAALSGDSGG